MILQVFGTSGSGKSTLVRAVVQSDYQSQELLFRGTVPVCRLPMLHAHVLGRYYTGKAMGVDGIRSNLPTPDAIFDAVRLLKAEYPDWSVIFEGLVATSSAMTLWRRWPAAFRATYWALLPDLDTCFARVVQRGGKARHEMAKNGHALVSKHRTAELLIPRLRAAGAMVRVWPATPLDTLVGAMRRQLAVAYHVAGKEAS